MYRPSLNMEVAMSSLSTTDRGAEILTRTIQPAEGDLPVEAARSLLSFRLAPADWERVNDLAAQARAGTLTTEERAELEEYERITCLLELLQSKARLSLKHAGLSS
jgi:hypothetical protein